MPVFIFPHLAEEAIANALIEKGAAKAEAMK